MSSAPRLGIALPTCPPNSGLPFLLPPEPEGVLPPLPPAGLGYPLPPSPCLTLPGLTRGPALPAELRGRDLRESCGEGAACCRMEQLCRGRNAPPAGEQAGLGGLACPQDLSEPLFSPLPPRCQTREPGGELQQ